MFSLVCLILGRGSGNAPSFFISSGLCPLNWLGMDLLHPELAFFSPRSAATTLEKRGGRAQNLSFPPEYRGYNPDAGSFIRYFLQIGLEWIFCTRNLPFSRLVALLCSRELSGQKKTVLGPKIVDSRLKVENRGGIYAAFSGVSLVPMGLQEGFTDRSHRLSMARVLSER
jgi:hypothetical protein